MPRVKLFNEEEVLEKAMNLFWKKGYYATSAQDLVECMGINRASIYDTFGGKKQLFEKSFVHYMTIKRDEQKAFLNQYEDVKLGFKSIFEAGLDESTVDVENKGCFVVNSSTEVVPNEEGFGPLVYDNKVRCKSLFLNYLTLGVERGQISKDKNLEAIANLFFTFSNGLKVVTKVPFDHETFSASVDSLLTVLD